MTYGFLIPLAVNLKMHDGEFSWDFEPPLGLASEYPNSPIGFHDPSQVAGTPLFEDDCFVVKFNNFWTVEAPPGYSLLCTHPVKSHGSAVHDADRPCRLRHVSRHAAEFSGALA